MGGPSWPKRVAFLGTAPGPGGHVGCILGLSWLALGYMGGPSWPKRVTFLGTAPGVGLPPVKVHVPHIGHWVTRAGRRRRRGGVKARVAPKTRP